MYFTAFARAIILILAAGAASLAAPSTPAAGDASRGASALSYNSTAGAGNVTINKAIPGLPFLSHIRCEPNFAHGRKVTPVERELLIGCYKMFASTERWLDRMTNCPLTRRYFQTWGHHWDSPPDCYNACKECFQDAVFDQAANLRCSKYEGISARCHVTYE
ncbi:hypothetical protein F4781DRAFT_436254 [Annulohypoxylon bovei var. microspora]|nr:hypothetical protein F4781DRAFT_436254 [Annulohypoxylon bovei var. microspora]